MVLISLVCWIAIAPDTSARASQTDDFQYFILVDVSGSMMGKPRGQTPVIFPQVKESISEFVRSVRPGAFVSVMPFHERIDGRRDFTIHTDADRDRIVGYINSLEARGQTTWIYHAIREALSAVEQKMGSGPNKRIGTLLLYTDGLNEGPDDLDLQSLLNAFSMIRGEDNNLFLKYITLGVKLSQRDLEALRGTPGVQVVENPSGVVNPVLPVEIAPSVLDFGSLIDGKSAQRTIRLNFPKSAIGKELRLAVSSPCVEEDGGLLMVEPEVVVLEGDEVTLTARIINHESVKGKRCAGTIELTGSSELVIRPDQLKVRFATAGLPILLVEAVGETHLGQSWELTLDGATPHPEFIQKIRIRRSGGVGDESVPVTIQARRGVQSGGSKLEMRLVGQPWQSDLKLVLENEPREIEVRMGVNQQGLGSGKLIWNLDLGCDDADLEGNGLSLLSGGVSGKTVQYELHVIKPFTWPMWTPYAIAVIGGIIALWVVWWLVCSVFTPRFVSGSRFELDDGTIVFFKSRCLKRWYSMGGFGSDIELPASPGGPQARVCASGPDILIVPEVPDDEIIRDSMGHSIDEDGVSLADGEFLSVESVKIHYRTGEI